jgi:MFS family permease
MPDSSENFKLGFAVRSLRHRNYRLFFGGQTLSLVGTWMTQVASSWLVYRLTSSALLLGLVTFSGQLPALLLTPFAGVWVDRWDRRTVLKVTQVLAMLESFALAVLVFSGHANIWYILGLTMFQGVVNAFDIPARQTFVVEMLEDRADLPNAIALNSSMMNGARLIGPSIAGAVIAVGGEAGEGYCFLIDGISYIAVIASLMLMNTKPGIARIHENLFSELKAGWRYVIGYDPIRSILALIAFISLVGLPYSVLLPVFAREILRGGPNTFGLLTGATGLGAFISAILLAMRKSIVGLGKRMAITSLMFGAALIAFAFSQIFWLSMLLMLVVGFSMMQAIASGNTILQTIVDEDKRGRVMSFYTLAFIGAAPIGSLLAGALADKVGAVPTVIVCGLSCIIASLWFFGRLENIRKIVRPLYVERGILP